MPVIDLAQTTSFAQKGGLDMTNYYPSDMRAWVIFFPIFVNIIIAITMETPFRVQRESPIPAVAYLAGPGVHVVQMSSVLVSLSVASVCILILKVFNVLFQYGTLYCTECPREGGVCADEVAMIQAIASQQDMFLRSLLDEFCVENCCHLEIVFAAAVP